ncbi:MAG: heavy-metal-associated domain-containing protein [Gammaproteobacteria bacterium]|nr:heavy-metal-associated domain-containing protein [Gammaproteobacteria bacterium]
MKRSLLVFTLLVSLGAATGHAGKSVEVNVNDMFCDMCAYGLSLSLNQLDGVKKAKVYYEEQRATVEMEDGVAADVERIRQVVVDSGFSPQEIRVID